MDASDIKFQPVDGSQWTHLLYPDGTVVQRSDLVLLERWRAHRTGLAPYYPLLYSLVIGMGAQRVFEFGTGESSQVLLSALKQTGGSLLSCSPAQGGDMVLWTTMDNWTLWHRDSATVLQKMSPFDAFDLVLHDGSHSAEVVHADLLGIIPKMKEGGLILVHDVLHSYVGKEMRQGVEGAVLRHWLIGASDKPDDGSGRVIERVRLPFAFGLEILQVSHPKIIGGEPVSIGPDKPTSPHHTLRWGET